MPNREDESVPGHATKRKTLIGSCSCIGTQRKYVIREVKENMLLCLVGFSLCGRVGPPRYKGIAVRTEDSLRMSCQGAGIYLVILLEGVDGPGCLLPDDVARHC